MPRLVNRLTARAIAALSAPGYYPDGAGLYLQVAAGGTKSWIFRYTRLRRSREMGLGPLALVSLVDARQAALLARRQLLAGVDPIEARKAAQAAQAGLTFGECSDTYIADHRAGWKSAKHAAQWSTSLANHAAALRALPVAQVATADVLAVLQPIWSTKNETATRVRERIGRILDWAKVKGYRAGDNPARWRGHLDKLLPPVRAVRKETHFAALPFAQIPAFMATLRERASVSARALEFLILTAARTSEVRLATWSELRDDRWVVPPAHTKGGREHVVPLSDRAQEILAGMKRTKHLEIFASHKGAMTNNALLAFLEELGVGHVTVHGFRSSFRDWAAETTHFPNEVAEMALGHAIRDGRRGGLSARQAASQAPRVDASVGGLRLHPVEERERVALTRRSAVQQRLEQFPVVAGRVHQEHYVRQVCLELRHTVVRGKELMVLGLATPSLRLRIQLFDLLEYAGSEPVIDEVVRVDANDAGATHRCWVVAPLLQPEEFLVEVVRKSLGPLRAFAREVTCPRWPAAPRGRAPPGNRWLRRRGQ